MIRATQALAAPTNAACYEWVSNVPASRSEAGLVYDPTRNVVVLFGGRESETGALFGETWEWNGSTWSQRLINGPAARFGHGMVYDPVRHLVVLHGGTTATGVVSDTWEYNGLYWLERTSVGGPPARTGHQLAFDPVRQLVLLFGGINNGTVFNDTWLYTGLVWGQLLTPSSPPPRARHSLTTLTANVVLFGGGGEDNGATALGDTWIWTGFDWVLFCSSNCGPTPRAGHGATYDTARDRLVIFGGSTLPGELGDSWELTPSGWAQLSPTSPPPERAYHRLAYDAARARTVLFGGLSGPSGTTWLWDGTNWSEPADSTPPARQAHAFVFQPSSGRAIAFGGQTGDSAATDVSNALSYYDLVSWVTPTISGSVPSARTSVAAAFDTARERLVVFSGLSASADTWEFNPAASSWLQRTPATNPSARYYSALAFDPSRNRVVLFGGFSGTTELQDTWEWDGTNWSQKATGAVTKPSARVGHALAYDPQTGGIVLSGGFTSYVAQSDLWRWDGTAWTQLTPAGASETPSARGFHALAYDSDRQKLMLYGGTNDPISGLGLADGTYEWEGATSTWQKLELSGPPNRMHHRLAYDSSDHVMLLYGGSNGSVSAPLSGEVWQFREQDRDNDGLLACEEQCDNDPLKSAPGLCGCGVVDADTNLNGIADCQDPRVAGVTPAAPTVSRSGSVVRVNMAPLAGVRYNLRYYEVRSGRRPKYVTTTSNGPAINFKKLRRNRTYSFSYRYILSGTPTQTSLYSSAKRYKVPRR